MTVKRRYGDIFETQCEAIVNPVNCVGVMGKGLAKVFRSRYPENYRAYQAACLQHQVIVGQMFITQVEMDSYLRYIINFPTKHHWSNPSQLEYIEDGLRNLKESLVLLKIRSVAIPALGCGCGALSWDQVAPRIVDCLGDLDDVYVELYDPT